VHCNFFVSLDAEGSDCVPSPGFNGRLIGEVQKHLGGLGQLIARFTSTEIDNEFRYLDFSHLVCLLYTLLSAHIFFLSTANLLIINRKFHF